MHGSGLGDGAAGSPPPPTQLCWVDRYPSVACEILTSDVPQINDALGADESLLHRLYGFLQSSGSLNPLLASFFSKVMGVLINRKTDQVPGPRAGRAGGRANVGWWARGSCAHRRPVSSARVLPAEEGRLRGPAAAAHRHLGHHGPAAAPPHLRGAAAAEAGRGQRACVAWPGRAGRGRAGRGAEPAEKGACACAVGPACWDPEDVPYAGLSPHASGQL